MTVRAVLFDIGNVLIEWQPERFFDRVLGEDQRAAFFAQVPVHDMTNRIDHGDGFADVIDAVAVEHPDWANALGIWHDRWIEMASPAIDHSVRLLRALRRAGYPVFALSNFGVETLQIAEGEYPFLEEFDRRYISGEMRVNKPDAEIYERVEADCGLPPDGLLFTDDRPENIDAAAKRGWQTHFFDGPEGWASRLVREGLLTKEAAA